MAETRFVSFLPVTVAQGQAIVAAMRTVAERGGPLRDEDTAALAGAAAHVLHIPIATQSAAPPAPQQLAEILPTPGLRRYACELIAIMAFVDGSIDREKIGVVLAYANALGVHDDYIRELGETALGHIAWLTADMSRNNATSIGGIDVNADFKAQFFPYDEKPDAALAGRFRGLAALPYESFGRAFYDHYEKNGYPFSGDRGGLTMIFGVPHDSTHLLSGYSTSSQGELLVSTFTAAMHRSRGMSGHILPVIFTFHLGVELNPLVGAHTGAFDAEKFWRAWERGRSVTIDTFGPDWDFWSLVETSTQTLRESYRVPVLEPAFAADGTPPPARPWE